MKKIIITLLTLALLSVNAFTESYGFFSLGYQGEFITYDNAKKNIHSVSLGFKNDFIFSNNLGVFSSIDLSIAPFAESADVFKRPSIDVADQLEIGGILDLGILYSIPVFRGASVIFGIGGFISFGSELIKGYSSIQTSESGIFSTFNSGISLKIDINQALSEKIFFKLGFTSRFILYRVEKFSFESLYQEIAGSKKILDLHDYSGFIISPSISIGFKL